MNYTHEQHNFEDNDLINGRELAKRLGVTGAAISKAQNPKNCRLDTYENSKGKKLFHEESARQTFFKNRNPSKITTATVGQKAIGLTNFGARVVAQQKDGLTAQAKQAGAAPVEMTDAEAYDFAESRAKREHFAADLAEMKAAETAGRLVDKVKVGVKVSELANSVKDRLLSLHIKVASAVLGPLEQQLVGAGVDPDAVRVVLSSGELEKIVGEAIRKEIVSACRDIVESERLKLG